MIQKCVTTRRHANHVDLKDMFWLFVFVLSKIRCHNESTNVEFEEACTDEDDNHSYDRVQKDGCILQEW